MIFEGQENITVKRKHKAIQLDLLSLFEEYGEHPITENFIVHDNNDTSYDKMMSKRNIIKEDKNVLISLVKKDNEKAFLDKSAKVYYTGKKFPTTVALNKLFYFMPYIKGKGVKDLWLIKVARLGFRKEGTPLEDKNDLRLVFEIEYVSPIFDDYQSVELKNLENFYRFNNI